MPIYEYRCGNGHNFDVMQRMREGPVKECQVCGAPAERVFRAPAVHFKGSGFYNTDYGTRKRSREQQKEGSSSDGGGAEKAAKSSDSGKSSESGGSSDSGGSSGGKSEKASSASSSS